MASAVERPDLILLSEAALTGYVSPRGDFDLTPFAEPEGPSSPTSVRLAEAARRFGCTVVGPVIESDGPRCYNAVHARDAAGNLIARYRKRHPWYPETWASAGSKPPPLFEAGGRRWTLGICFDLHFLADDAHDQLVMADGLLFPSAWCESEPGDDSRPELVGEVARTYRLHVVNANWGEGSPRLPGQGGSMVVGPDGGLLARAGNSETALAVDL